MRLYIYLFLMMIFTGINISAKNKQPNFIFILVDDLGKEWISSYGATEVNTPNIDRVALQGIKFNKAYSMPQCTPSRVALMTGQYPYKNGWINHYDVPRWGHGAKYDPDKNPAFAKELRKAGYKTCVAGKWQVNDFRLEPEAMVNAGFDDYCMWTGYESDNAPSANRYWNPYIHTKAGSKTYKGKFGPDVYSDFIINFIKKNKKQPMCIYYPMVLTHTPFVHTPNEPNVKTNFEKHKAMVRYTDFIVGKIVKSLDELDIRDNTYLIFTTDNGTTSAMIGKRNKVYVRGGKTYLTENGINAPFIITGPGKLKGIESDALVDFTDIYPTLLDLAGVKHNSGYNIDGKSFANILSGKDKNGSRNWALSMGSHVAKIGKDGRVNNYFSFRDRIIRDEKHKIYVDTLKQIYRIFDMENDPYETQNLISEKNMTEVLSKFQSILNDIPKQDNNPKYKKLLNSLYDIPVEEINKKSERSHKNLKNMRPLATEEEFYKVVNNKKQKSNKH